LLNKKTHGFRESFLFVPTGAASSLRASANEPVS